MLREELKKKLRRIEFHATRLVEEHLAGSYHSVFKGKGIEFSEVREYQIGDEVRFIDWNVTARKGVPHTKVFVEERELTVHVLVDVSGSLLSGSTNAKREFAAEIAAVLAFSAALNQDKVGALLFSDKIEKYVPPRKGRKQVMRIITDILSFEPSSAGTNIEKALEYFLQIYPKRGIAFLISDFTVREPEKLREPLSIVRKKHDLIGIFLRDSVEENLPEGKYRFYDLESGEEIMVDLTGYNYQLYHDWVKRRIKSVKDVTLKSKVDVVDIFMGTDFLPPLMRFFQERKKRLRR